MSPRPSIGLIGAGLMGAGIAHCLLQAGHPVALLAHKSRTAVDALLSSGATEAPTLQALASNEVILTCLPNADTVEAIARDLIPHLQTGQIWIDVTTSRPDTSIALAATLASQGVHFADAPVTGGPPQAREGALASLIGCEEAIFAQIEALVAPYSKVVRRFGGPGTGHAAKLLNNLVTQGTMLLLADAFQIAAARGIDAAALYDVMQTGAARSGTLEKSVGPALDGRFDGARFSIANAAKDLAYARDLLASTDPARSEPAKTLAACMDAYVKAGHGDDFVSTLLDPATHGQRN